MIRGRTSRALPILGLSFLVFAGFFLSTTTVSAQNTPALPGANTDIAKIGNSDLANLINSCAKSAGLNLGNSSNPSNLMQNYFKAIGGGLLSVQTDLVNKPCNSSTPIGGKAYTTACQTEYLNRNLGDVVCRIKAPDGSNVVTTGNATSQTYQFTYYDASGKEIGNSDGATNSWSDTIGSAIDPSLSTSNGETGINEGKNIAGSAEAACSFTDGNFGDCLVNILAKVISGIEWLILVVAAGILGLANYLLGWSTYITVFQFGNLVGNSDGLLAAWGVMRDVANIILLFGFIFLGVSTILNLPSSEYTAKKAIPSLIIFALLLNFSLFAVEGVIDISNAFATSIYEQATGGSGVCESTTSTVDCTFSQGIGGQVMTLSGITSIFDFTNGEKTFGDGGTTTVVVYAGLIVFAVITTLVLAAAAIMLIIRAVVLAFLMVTAPIGFAGMAIPPLHEMAQKWWKELLSQAFFAPIYFLLALVSLKIMSGVIIALTPASSTVATTATGQNLLGAAAAASATSGSASTVTSAGTTGQNLAAVFTASVNGGHASNITVVMTFALIIGFMIAALMFAKSSSAHGTSIAMAGAGKLAFGTLGFVGRQTGGRVALLAANKIATSRIGRTSIGRGLYGIANKGASSSFDFRKTGGGKKLEGAVGGLGTVRKNVEHGMHGIEEDKIKARVDYAKKIKQTSDEAAQEAKFRKDQEQIDKDKASYQVAAATAGTDLENEINRYESQTAANAQVRKTAIQAQKDLIETEERAPGANQAVVDKLKDDLKKLEAADAATRDAERQGLELRTRSLRNHQKATNDALKKYDEDRKRAGLQITGGVMYESDGRPTEYTGVNRDAAVREYGQNLQNSVLAQIAHGSPIFTEFTPGGITGHANYEAGAQVIRNAAKTGTERAIADLQSALGTSAPSAPAPAAGAPSAGGGHH